MVPITTPCIIHTGYIMPNGYGRDKIDGKMVSAHRKAYEDHYGSIPDGLVIDHLCRVRSCVNPEHLEAVTQSENVLRGDGPGVWYYERHYNVQKTHCKHGHEFTKENTIVRIRDNREQRECRECGRLRNRAYKARVRSQA